MIDLSAAAQREVAARERHWPAEVAAERMEATQAEADIVAWRTIATLMKDGCVDTLLSWTEMIEIVRSSIVRQLERFAVAPLDRREALDGRINALAAMLRLLETSARSHGAAVFRDAA